MQIVRGEDGHSARHPFTPLSSPHDLSAPTPLSSPSYHVLPPPTPPHPHPVHCPLPPFSPLTLCSGSGNPSLMTFSGRQPSGSTLRVTWTEGRAGGGRGGSRRAGARGGVTWLEGGRGGRGRGRGGRVQARATGRGQPPPGDHGPHPSQYQVTMSLTHPKTRYSLLNHRALPTHSGPPDHSEWPLPAYVPDPCQRSSICVPLPAPALSAAAPTRASAAVSVWPRAGQTGVSGTAPALGCQCTGC